MFESQKDGLSDIPDYNGLEDEAFPPLPPPHSSGLGGGQEPGELFEDADEGDVSRLPEVPAAKRKGVKRPQPKLDSQRLTSERGLPALLSLFDNVRFKGKGQEAEDLRLLMQKMENWAHRLFPRLQFEDFIDKVEKLGSKKEVQTCLKRIRLDMPLSHEDFVGKEGEEEVPPEVQVLEDFDPFSSEGSANEPGEPVHSTPGPAAPTPPSLTEEQLRLMELNRQRALERRIARQQQTGNGPPSASLTNVLNSSTDQQEGLEDLNLDQSSSTQRSADPPAPPYTGPEPPSPPHTGPEPPAPPHTGPEPPAPPHTGPEPPAPPHTGPEPPSAPPHTGPEPPSPPPHTGPEPPAPPHTGPEPPAPPHTGPEPPSPPHTGPEPPAPPHTGPEPPAPPYTGPEPPAPPHTGPEPLVEPCAESTQG